MKIVILPPGEGATLLAGAENGERLAAAALATPLDAITTHDRFGLVTVASEDYAIADIGMRMLAPRELYRAQGFPDTYAIEVEHAGKPLTKTAQVRMCGNSVCPPMGAALVDANLCQPAPARRSSGPHTVSAHFEECPR